MEELKCLVEEAKVDGEKGYALWCVLRPMWHKWAYKMTFVRDEQSDWEQESFLIFQEALATYDLASAVSFTGYYRMFLYRWGKKQFTKKGAIDYSVEPLEGKEGVICDEGIAVEEEVVEACTTDSYMKRLLPLIGELKPQERQLLWDHFFYNKSLGSMAKAYGLTYDAVECKKRRLLKKLAKGLQKSDGYGTHVAI